jgi:Pro-kumamolisin, activation domain/Bacterial Ig-like domain (group 3)
MQFWKCLVPVLASTLCFAAQSDRITAPIDSSQRVALTGNVHGFAQTRFDLGLADNNKVLHGVTLAFRPSAAQQADLNNLLAQQQDRSSPNYHRWLTPAQFADRFGMTRDDISRIVAWLESQGFTVTSVANSRNQIAFNGTVAQIETVFHTEIHNYLVDGVIHFANATNPSVPAALAGVVLAVGNLHDFRPKPRVRVSPHFTSATSGNHFLTPGDFATIYDLPAGVDGTGQTIAVVGQTAVDTNDIANFRSAAGLPAKLPTLLLVPDTGSSEVFSSDEIEADLDLEWSNGVAKNATVIFVYVGSDPNATVWNSLQYALDNNVAPVISISYGACETANGQAFDDMLQSSAQQGNAQGQTIMASSGDSGAAGCDSDTAKSATGGLAVGVPASIPEVTGVGGTEFFGDATSTSTTTYWLGATGSDTINSAVTYIPEEAWNDTATDDALSASGGGASLYFSKPSWQSSDGIAGTTRDVPDVALSASADHDPYLICSPTDNAGNPACTNGFRDSSTEGYLDVVGGTSCGAPSFAGIVALLNQYLGSSGLGNINPTLYSIAASTPAAFHDVTTDNNDVPCTSGTANCPTGTTQFGFSAGVGYDQVTGLGSVVASKLFTAWAASRTASSVTITHVSATNVNVGTSVSFTVSVTPTTGVGTVSFSTLNGANTTVLGTATLNVPYPGTTTATATFTTSALPGGSNSVTATYEGDTSDKSATSTPTTVTVVVPFSMSASALSPSSVPAGQTAISTITITPMSGFTGTVNFTNSTASNPESCSAGLPTGALCSFNPGGVTLDGNPAHTMNVTLTITTAPNMALPSGAQAITVAGTSGSTTVTTPVSLTVTATTESYTLTTTAATFGPVAAGGSQMVSVTVNSSTGFIVGSGAGATTALPLTYTCTGTPSLTAAEIACQLPNNGQPINATAVAFTLSTTPPTAQLRPPLGRGSPVFYALLLPGLFGIVLAAGSRTRSVRMLSLMVVLGFSTLWLGSCGGSGGGGTTTPKNPGTPAGSYTVTINATTGGPVPVTTNASPLTFTFNVSQ